MTQLAHRFRQEAFRRYENMIALVVKNWPAVQTIDPMPYSVETYRARFRDAMRSHLDNHWPSSLIDWEAFLEVHPEICVAIRGNKILIGPRELVVVTKQVDAGLASGSNLEHDMTIPDATNEVLLSIAVLLHHRHLRAVELVFTSPKHPGIDFAKSLDASYDVELIELEPNYRYRII